MRNHRDAGNSRQDLGVHNRSGSPGAPGQPGSSGQMPGQRRRMWWFFLALLLTNYLIMRVLSPLGDDVMTIPYTEFKQQVANSNVRSIYSQGRQIEGQFLRPVTVPSIGSTAPVTGTNFTTLLPDFVDPGFESF